MDDDLFRKNFTLSTVPHWPCPRCARGLLRIKKEDFHSEYDGATDDSKDAEAFDHDWVRYVYHGLLRCNLCSEKVVFVGNGFVEQDYDETSPNGWSYFDYYSPKAFYPAVLLIEIENQTLVPPKVLESTMKACELFWADLNSCANRIRTAIEYMLDDLKIPRSVRRPKKRLDLHQRIQLIQQAGLEDIKTMLEAVKWIGNAGTHEVGQLNREQIIEGFRMLEHCLSILYPKPKSDSSAILAIAKAVNSARGVLDPHTIKTIREKASS